MSDTLLDNSAVAAVYDRRAFSLRFSASTLQPFNDLALVFDLYLELRVVHARVHAGHVVNAATVAMEKPGRSPIGDLKLLVGDAWLLITIVAVRANESHVFVVNDGDVDVELIDPVYDDLDIRPS